MQVGDECFLGSVGSDAEVAGFLVDAAQCAAWKEIEQVIGSHVWVVLAEDVHFLFCPLFCLFHICTFLVINVIS